MVKFLQIFSLFALLNFTAFAQDQKDTSTYELDEFTVTENRINTPFPLSNRNVSIINKADLGGLPVRSVPEVLNYIPGVEVRQRGPMGIQADLSIRGGTFDQALVLLNGVKMIDPQTGHHSLAVPLHLNNIYQVQVLKEKKTSETKMYISFPTCYS